MILKCNKVEISICDANIGNTESFRKVYKHIPCSVFDFNDLKDKNIIELVNGMIESAVIKKNLDQGVKNVFSYIEVFHGSQLGKLWLQSLY